MAREEDPNRGTYRTTTQLAALKGQSCFIWSSVHMTYVRNLCVRIGGSFNHSEGVWTRPDGAVVHVYSRSILTFDRVSCLAGRYFREVVLDHALRADMSAEEYWCYERALERVRSDDYFHTPVKQMRSPRAVWEPISMELYCPLCHERHIDEGEWVDRLHHTHSCQKCGHTWRPAVVYTLGVQFLPGFKNK